MPIYAAFLRGIGPTNPNMHSARLRGVFEALGLKGVKSHATSGNLRFESATRNAAALETKIERALTAQLGIRSDVFLRTGEELSAMIEKNPFGNKRHGRDTYLTVTFTKGPPREVFNSTAGFDPVKASALMRRLETEYSKRITTRTWNTVQKMAALCAKGVTCRQLTGVRLSIVDT